MASLRTLFRNRTAEEPAPDSESQAAWAAETVRLDLDIAPNDPLLVYLQSTSGAVDITRLNLDSPGLEQLREAGVTLIMPLVSQGELIGMINLGPRMSEQDYSSDDRKLLGDLASQAAPAVRVAQLVRQQQVEARERERIEQELRVARIIQQTLLPHQLPDIAGYEVAAHYQPAREVGGDFYDFLYFDDGRVGIVVGDVTDKGVPAALVMATTRTLLRAAAERMVSPGQVLERVNDLLYPDIPPKMFVTCLYALLETGTGRLKYANAGHDLPYRRTAHGVEELRATGMPLGLMPGMAYEEKEIVLQPGETILFHSDGLVEAHNPQRDMFSFGRLRDLMSQHEGSADLIPFLLEELATFTGPDWEQEDDVTLVTLQRAGVAGTSAEERIMDGNRSARTVGLEPLANFQLPSQQGNERRAMEEVARVVEPLGLEAGRLERLKTAVAEATMNAMEHGNQYRPDKPVAIAVLASPTQLAVRITDHGGGRLVPEAEVPDLDAKLAGLQSPRGWGLFLIQNMVDELNVASDDTHHTVELIMHLGQGGDHDS